MPNKTYAQLKADALLLADETGNTEAGSVAELGLHEAMKYIASRVRLDSLVGTATTAWPGGATAELFGTDFTITDASSPLEPLELYVSADATEIGFAYEYRRFLDWKRLAAHAGKERVSIISSFSQDRRPDRSFTVNPQDQVEVRPEPIAGELLTLHYKKGPAAYLDANTPEIPETWESLVTNGAIMYIKEWVRQPEQIVNPHELFQALDPQLQRMERQIRGLHARPRLTMHRSYETS